MHPYLGDFGITQTVRVAFNSSDLGAVPITLAGSPALFCYRDDSTTEDNSGLTLTADYDGRTGLHRVNIDLTADAAFFENGHDFFVVVTAGTVAGVSVVGKCVAQFSIRNRSAHAPLPDSLTAIGSMPTPDQAILQLFYRWCTFRVKNGSHLEFYGVDHATMKVRDEIDNPTTPLTFERVATP